MSAIGYVGSLTTAPAASAAGSSRGGEFGGRLDASLGTGGAHHAHRHGSTQATGAGAASQVGGADTTTTTQVQNASSLFGDVFGALGADTSAPPAALNAAALNAAGQTATAAYRRHA